MTISEARSILHCPDTVGGLYSEKYGEALNMAMEALKREPCEDCISRQAAIRIAEQGQVQGYMWQFKELVKLPSVTPQPKTGRWIDRFPAKECKCSVCDFLICISNGSYIDMVGQMKYCPNCGARMVNPQESEDKE